MAKRQRGRDVSGIILLDKPQGESSNTSLQRVRRLFNAAKAGHTGSLDPLATGVLPLCFGEATKISQFLLDSDKAYRTRIRLGQKTDTGDADGQVIAEVDVNVDQAQLQQALQQFRGDIEQLPPMYSALKHEGVPLYKLARKGIEVERKPRRVSIYRLELLAFENNEVELEVHCSKGTYIRSIADDLGASLGCGAHIRMLRRIKAGPFVLEKCLTFQELEEKLAAGQQVLDDCLVAADLALPELPAVHLPVVTADYVLQGQAVMSSGLPTEGLVRLYRENDFIGIGHILDDGRVAPKRLMRI